MDLVNNDYELMSLEKKKKVLDKQIDFLDIIWSGINDGEVFLDITFGHYENFHMFNMQRSSKETFSSLDIRALSDAKEKIRLMIWEYVESERVLLSKQIDELKGDRVEKSKDMAKR